MALSHGRTNRLIESLVGLGLLTHWGSGDYNRRFAAPRVLDIRLGSDPSRTAE